MPRVALDLNKAEDRRHVKGEWRVAAGLVPGAPNEGLTSRLLSSPARLCGARRFGLGRVLQHSRESLGGLHLRVVPDHGRSAGDRRDRAGGLPAVIRNQHRQLRRDLDRREDRPEYGVIVGLNAQHRVEVSASAVIRARHVIACLVGNGPLAESRGGIFRRYATLAFESPG